jgi:hypothetical protein
MLRQYSVSAILLPICATEISDEKPTTARFAGFSAASAWKAAMNILHYNKDVFLIFPRNKIGASEVRVCLDGKKWAKSYCSIFSLLFGKICPTID